MLDITGVLLESGVGCLEGFLSFKIHIHIYASNSTAYILYYSSYIHCKYQKIYDTTYDSDPLTMSRSDPMCHFQSSVLSFLLPFQLFKSSLPNLARS
jgi:hypothetical protein